jgi:hypothetical protein
MTRPLLRLKKPRDDFSQTDLGLGRVSVESLPEVSLRERLAECIRSCDPDPKEAERLRLEYLQERG